MEEQNEKENESNAEQTMENDTLKTQRDRKEKSVSCCSGGGRRFVKGVLFFLFLFFMLSFLAFSVFDFMSKKEGLFGILDNNNQVVQPVKVVDEQSQVIEVAKKASPAVVSIIATAEVPTYETLYEQFFNFSIPSQVQNGTEKKQVSAGTGFLVSADGYIITNKHVVEDEGAEYTVILNNEKNFDEKITAKVLARDPNNDIAVLKIDKTDLPFLDLGDSDSLQVGQTAIAIGYALGEFDNTVSKGVVSGLYRSITAGTGRSTENLQNLIQTDAAVNPGNSGGPLLDIEGNVIGVNVAMADAQSIGFAIPINEVKDSYEEVKSSGTIKKDSRAFLGVRYIAVDDNIQEKNDLPYNYGVIIVRGEERSDLAIVPGSPADKAGLAENDIILEVNGEKVTARNSLQKLINKYQPGDEIKLKVYKDGAEKEISLKLEESK